VETRELQAALRRIGWPLAVDGELGPATRTAVGAFQEGYNLGPWLAIDEVAGPITRRALDESIRQGGKCSPNFRYVEFRSKGNGWIRCNRRLLAGLERYRQRLGAGVFIVSGYRDPAHNRRVGGATRSRHMLGDAADVPPRLSVGVVRDLGVFTGIGYDAATGRVRHVDTRPGDPRRPTTWRYG
jgi:peptidoglycan hydrolase-like protein with peptidoglycan-binding domain